MKMLNSAHYRFQVSTMANTTLIITGGSWGLMRAYPEGNILDFLPLLDSRAILALKRPTYWLHKDSAGSATFLLEISIYQFFCEVREGAGHRRPRLRQRPHPTPAAAPPEPAALSPPPLCNRRRSRWRSARRCFAFLDARREL